MKRRAGTLTRAPASGCHSSFPSVFRSHSCRCSSRVASPVDTAAWKSPFSTAGSRDGEALSKIVDFYPEDTNALQISCLSCGGRDLVFYKLWVFGCGGTGIGKAGAEGFRMPGQPGHMTRPCLKRVKALASYT
ncbi:nuclear receptor 2C2-associated protein isoform 4 [Rattus norvegicus]|uniref:Nuclear receptor 2C2-associated protein n=1 Tax=Rattus norvegicus TaxID=10116 RepID=A0ABZ3NND5_RAT|nr:nuclear receptor 2C2-associated protein isoform 4 [Rattus norvegicus]